LTIKKMTLKNPTTNKHHSLSDNTLISIPSSSPENIILHGIEQGKEIQLDVGFNKINYVEEAFNEGSNGKTVSIPLLEPTNKILGLKEVE
jgi:hypothetical protein